MEMLRIARRHVCALKFQKLETSRVSETHFHGRMVERDFEQLPSASESAMVIECNHTHRIRKSLREAHADRGSCDQVSGLGQPGRRNGRMPG